MDYHYPDTYVGGMTDPSVHVAMVGGSSTPTSSSGYPLTSLNGAFINFNGLTAGWGGDYDRGTQVVCIIYVLDVSFTVGDDTSTANYIVV